MITFIDTVNGNAFDAKDPYVFWFEDGQSTNLNYVKQICIYSNRSVLTMKIDSPVFSVLSLNQYVSNIEQYPRIEMNKKKYVDLNNIKTKKYQCKGYQYNDNFVYLFYILASSKDAGEYIDRFEIEETSATEEVKPTHTFSIGADFYNINEVLQSNMENLEIKLPESIQKAIYESNLHEESNDNILLNRKHKELLMNYWDIVANKGSYESLTNSLKWFEWGDLVRIEEMWKVYEKQGEIDKLKEFQTQINDEMRIKMSAMTKSTYIGLYCAIYKIEHNTQGDTVYEDTYNVDPQRVTNRIHAGDKIVNMKGKYNVANLGGKYPEVIQTSTRSFDNIPSNVEGNKILNEETPNLKPIVSLWNNLDLSLKMTLLGNFYQTFFMPIHMDLIHSTIEAWVYSNTLKLLHVNNSSRIDLIDCVRSFQLRETERKHQMRAYHTYTYLDTLFKSDDDLTIRGVEDKVRESTYSSDIYAKDPPKDNVVIDSTYHVQHFFNSECGLVTFTGKVKSKSPIWKEKVSWYENGELQVIDDNVFILPIKEKESTEIDTIPLYFSLQFKKSGTYKLFFELTNTSSIIYSRSIVVTIDNDFRNHLSIYKLTPRTDYRLENLTKNIQATGLYFNLSDNKKIKKLKYTQESIFISEQGGFPLTHVISAPVISDDVITIHRDKTNWTLKELNDEYNFDSFAGSLSDIYWIYKIDRRIVPTSFTGDVSTIEPTTFVTCISKNLYKSSDEKPLSLTRTFKEGEIDELRFSPVFYNLEPFNDIKVNPNEVLYITPEIRHSQPITYGHWEFKNMSTLKSTFSNITWMKDYPESKYMGDYDKILNIGGKQTTLFTGYTPEKLNPGYYSIILHYREGKQEYEQEIKLNSAFILDHDTRN